MDSFEMKFDSIVKHESGHEMSLKMFLRFVDTLQYLSKIYVYHILNAFTAICFS